MQGVCLFTESLLQLRDAEWPGCLERWLETAGGFPVWPLFVQMGGSEDTERSISHMKFGFL